ncbi:Zinc finger putative Transcription Factor family [Ditylenchus destructor]|nr:Zinc finger putative Transcription Factor family [Ditylenchus destructor]
MLECHLCSVLRTFESDDDFEAHLATDHFNCLPYFCGQCQLLRFPTELLLCAHYEKMHQLREYTVLRHHSAEIFARRQAIKKAFREALIKSLSQYSNNNNGNVDVITVEEIGVTQKQNHKYSTLNGESSTVNSLQETCNNSHDGMNHLLTLAEVSESQFLESRDPSGRGNSAFSAPQTLNMEPNLSANITQTSTIEETQTSEVSGPSSSAALLLSQCAAVIESNKQKRGVKQEIDELNVNSSTRGYDIDTSVEQNEASTSQSRKRPYDSNVDESVPYKCQKCDLGLIGSHIHNLPDKAMFEESIRVQREAVVAMHSLVAALKRSDPNKSTPTREYRQRQLKSTTFVPTVTQSAKTPGRPRMSQVQGSGQPKKSESEPMKIRTPGGDLVCLSEISDQDLITTLDMVRNNPNERVLWKNKDITEKVLKLDLLKVFREPEKAGRTVIDFMFHESFMYDKYVPGIHRLRKFALEFATSLDDAGRKFSGGEAIDDEYAVLFYDILNKLGASALDQPSRRIYMTKAKAGIDSRRRESFQRKEGKAIAWKYYGPQDGEILFPNERGNEHIVKPWLIGKREKSQPFWGGVVNYNS